MTWHESFRATSLADQLLPAAREVEETLSEAERHVTGKDSELSGQIKLSLPAVPVTHIAEAVAEFAIQYPRIELNPRVLNGKLCHRLGNVRHGHSRQREFDLPAQFGVFASNVTFCF